MKNLSASKIQSTVNQIKSVQQMILDIPELKMEASNIAHNTLSEEIERLEHKLRYVAQAEEIEKTLNETENMRRILERTEGMDYDARNNMWHILTNEIARLECLLKEATKKGTV